MLDSLSTAVREQIKDTYNFIGHFEGSPSDGWLVTDFGDVVVHLFSLTSAAIIGWKNCGKKGKSF